MNYQEDFTPQLQQSMDLFNRLLDNLHLDQLDIQIHETIERWTTVEILRHIAFSEKPIARLIKSVISGEAGVAGEFDLKRSNEIARSKLQNVSLDVIKSKMREARQMTMELLLSIQSEDWEKTGRYFNQDIMTVKRMFELLIWHQSHHTQQILDKIG